MVYNVNDHVATASTLLRKLDSIIIDIERGEEMLARLANYPKDRQVSPEVLAFIQQYSNTCSEVSVESVTGAIDTIGKILTGLRKALVRMYEILREVFRLLFDSQYRSRKVFIDLHRNLLVISSNTNAVRDFEQIQCTVIAQKDAIDSMEKSANLNNLIRFVAECTDDDGIARLLTQFNGIAGVHWKDNRLEDACEEIAAQRFANFKEAGWDIDGLDKAISKHIDCLSGIEVLKETQSKIEKEIRQLSNRVTTAMYDNVSIEQVTPLQMQIAIRVRITKIIASAIDILIKRSSAISNILRAINAEVVKISEQYNAAR